jgi:hypothetical protein
MGGEEVGGGEAGSGGGGDIDGSTVKTMVLKCDKISRISGSSSDQRSATALRL